MFTYRMVSMRSNRTVLVLQYGFHWWLILLLLLLLRAYEKAPRRIFYEQIRLTLTTGCSKRSVRRFFQRTTLNADEIITFFFFSFSFFLLKLRFVGEIKTSGSNSNDVHSIEKAWRNRIRIQILKQTHLLLIFKFSMKTKKNVRIIIRFSNKRNTLANRGSRQIDF